MRKLTAFHWLAGLYSLLQINFVQCATIDPNAVNASSPPGTSFRDQLRDGDPAPLMIVIPAGDFVMGTDLNEPTRFSFEGPQHRVTFHKPFAMSRYEITFTDYDRFVIATGYTKPSDQGWGWEYWGRTNTAVFNVTWFDAQRYVQWLSEQTGQRYSLPSEAQWEYAARAGTTSIFNTGDCITSDDANLYGTIEFPGCPKAGIYRGLVLAVGAFKPNAWGLFDMHGNVFEWTQDCWHRNYFGAPIDGSAWLDDKDEAKSPWAPPANCSIRVLRGGDWSSRPRDSRSGYRVYNFDNFKSIYIGFRVVRELNNQN